MSIGLLELEEANLLHARRLARRNQWWGRSFPVMQGLTCSTDYQGRTAEWARLVAEIVPDYCTAGQRTHLGSRGAYSVVMAYRVELGSAV